MSVLQETSIPQTPARLRVVLEEHFTPAAPRSLSLTNQAAAAPAVNTGLRHDFNPHCLLN